jgi:hypothetical protein
VRENHPRKRQLAKERNKLARIKASRANIPIALIVCEGKKTELAYLWGLSALPDWLQSYAARLQQAGLFSETPDQVIINE